MLLDVSINLRGKKTQGFLDHATSTAVFACRFNFVCVNLWPFTVPHLFIYLNNKGDWYVWPFRLMKWYLYGHTFLPQKHFASYHGCALCGKLSGSLWYPGLWRCGPHLWLLPTNRHLQLNVIKVLPVNQLSWNPVGTEYRPECVSLSGGSALLSIVYIQQDWCLLSLIV